MRVCAATACRQRPRWFDAHCRQHAIEPGRGMVSRLISRLIGS